MVGIIGAGNMGGAIAGALAEAGMQACIYDIDSTRCLSLSKKYSNLVVLQGEAGLIVESNILIIAVKPQIIDPLLDDIAECGNKDKLIISIAAGITTNYIESKLPFQAKVIRCMPNLPVKVGKGITALCKGANASDEDLLHAIDLFGRMGKILKIEESEMDKITAVSGSGPGYIYHLLAILQRSVQKLGFSQEQAKDLVMGVVKGSVELIEPEDEFSDLSAMVCSKGGTTEAGISAFKDSDLENIFDEVLNRAHKRAKDLSK